ncbi:MAG: hypothetical protein JWO09_3421 [Bacteroidetes bacterium]|nr:hypothetical protein [Bacteroidota bacterium]
MAEYPVFDDVDLKDLYKDLNKAMYMLHHVDEEVFSKEEIKEVAFAIKITLNSLEKRIFK